MPTCTNGHAVAESVAFCHECGAQVPVAEPAPFHPHVPLYLSIASVVVIVLGLFAIAWVLNDSKPTRVATDSPVTSPTVEPAPTPVGGRVCARVRAHQVGVIGTHTSCDFARSVRDAYLTAGGHGQALTVTATSSVTRETYRNITCVSGSYVVCVGGRGHTARVFFGPFAESSP